MSIDDLRKIPLDKEGSANFFNNIKKLWIEPELKKRLESGSIKPGFEVKKCLILMPPASDPIIQFNEEAHLIALARKDHDSSFQKNESVYVYQLQQIISVELPRRDGKRIAFIFLNLIENNWEIFFDFGPNDPDWKEELLENKWEDPLGKMIAESLQKILTAKTIELSQGTQEILNNIGLWVVPSLLPYPLSMIIKKIIDGDKLGAMKLLITHCNTGFIDKISANWWHVKQFEERKQLLEEAISNHKEKKYSSSIHTLLPQLEGIITNWIYTQIPEEQVPFRQESKTAKFRDLVLDQDSIPTQFKTIVTSAIEFILNGPVLSSFQRWTASIDMAFPKRHVVEHGKYDPSFFTEENSIKLILLLDTICYMISSKNDKK